MNSPKPHWPLVLLGIALLIVATSCHESSAENDSPFQPWLGTWAGEGSWRKYVATEEEEPRSHGELSEESKIHVQIGIYLVGERAFVSYSWRFPGKPQIGDGGYMEVPIRVNDIQQTDVALSGAEQMSLTLHTSDASTTLAGKCQTTYTDGNGETSVVHQFEELQKVQDRPHRHGEDHFARLREQMVKRQLQDREITNESVIDAMSSIPRHRFVADASQLRAYSDGPLPIGYGQTISQPYIVALMTQLARPEAGDRVLDVGTGSGYQAAVLAELSKEVYSIEIIKSLAEEAQQRLEQLEYENVTVKHGDGYLGWPEHAPFDAIVVAAAPDHVPRPLVEQLAPGGRLVIPVGRRRQNLLVIEKSADGRITQRSVVPVAFVPMTGRAQQR